VFPDQKTQWRLNWFNEIKMPMLTSILLQNVHDDINDRMEQIKNAISLDSLMTDEIFIKNAMKNNTLHKIAKELLSDKINEIIEEKSATPIREVDTATFMARMNDKLLEVDE